MAHSSSSKLTNLSSVVRTSSALRPAQGNGQRLEEEGRPDLRGMTRYDGNNHISVNTGSQWHHETLYRSSKGRYYLEATSDYSGSIPEVRFLEAPEAAAWPLANSLELPGDLVEHEAAILE